MSSADDKRIAQWMRQLPAPSVPTEELDRRVLGELPELIVQQSEQRLRKHHDGDLLADGLAAVTPPADLDRRIREDLHREVIELSERRLRDNPAGDALAEGFAPVEAPADVDWAAAVIDHQFSSEHATQNLADQEVATPGWLWSHIRSDLHRYRLEQRRHARRTLALRAGVLAATISVTALLFHATGADTRPKAEELDIVFVRSERPLSAGYSPSDIARRVRDGR